ncbi:DUF7344 domain-containing protein [Halococcus sediminicola]|uniref:DUF7344 domain-containing protein n=1 Tax=Halococcus sediminicola TaxID=1264579 RepID=UPI000678CA84|nr:hypothetical protein [Halococcus sediminicola]
MSSIRDTTPLTEYEIHDVLRNERRTQVLRALQREQTTQTLRELSEQLATHETGEQPPPRNIRESVYNSLHQTHLPKLDKMGIVDYERNRKLITLADDFDQIALYMEAVPENDVPWATYYLALGVIALAVTALSSMGVLAFVLVPVLGWIALFFSLFLFSALYQRWSVDRIRLDRR